MRNFEKEKEKDREERAMNLELKRNFEEEKEKDIEERAMIVIMMNKMSNQMTGLE